MNTPFNQPNLSNFIKEGSEAVLENITFGDGTELLSAQPIATNASNINANLVALNSKAGLTTNTFTGAQTFTHAGVDTIQLTGSANYIQQTGSTNAFIQQGTGSNIVLTKKLQSGFGNDLTIDSDNNLIISTDGTVRMRVQNNGLVGIGTATPTNGLLHITGSVNHSLNARFYNSLGNNNSANTSRALSAYFSNMIACDELQVFSDQRIKENIVEIDDGASLQKLRDISCVWYNYKDKVDRGNRRVAGFLAQQVKEHLPEAVSIMRGFIPDEMRKLDVTWDNSNNMISDLKDVSGLKYRFYVSNDITGNDEIMKEVLGNEDNTFTFDASYKNVFCYGKEIDDFHTLHKSKLFAINFSATQELDRKITILENRLAALENR